MIWLFRFYQHESDEYLHLSISIPVLLFACKHQLSCTDVENFVAFQSVFDRASFFFLKDRIKAL